MTRHVSDTLCTLLFSYLNGLLLLSSFAFTFVDGLCNRTIGSNCQCKTETGKVVDLSPLVNTTTYPLFSNITGTKDGALYSYKPCTPMSVPVNDPTSPCHNVAVCRVLKQQILDIGDSDPVEFLEDSSTRQLYIQYKTINYTTNVYLVCAKYEKSLSVQGETNPGSNTYVMTLSTKYACISDDSQPKQHLSPGSILLILFFTGFLVYLVGGILVLRCIRGARGYEQIPHYDFWLDFPALVKDGMMFVARGCKSDADRTYDQI